jgi:hypothetical protein
VLAVDPGGTTGLAMWEDGTFRAWHEPRLDAMRTVDILCGGRLDLMVFESFHLSQQTLKKSERDALDVIEFIGVGRFLAGEYHVAFETQSPSEAKAFTTDAKLKALGWWTKGLDHPRDATRHLVLALAKRRLLDLSLLARAGDVE